MISWGTKVPDGAPYVGSLTVSLSESTHFSNRFRVCALSIFAIQLSSEGSD